MVQKKNQIDKCLYRHNEWNLTASTFLMAVWLKRHGFRPVSFTMPYSKLYILSVLSAYDVKCMSIDRQKLDLSKYIYLWYRKFYTCRDTARFYEHKNDPPIRLNITNQSQEVSPFPAGDHNAAMNRHESMTNTRHK